MATPSKPWGFGTILRLDPGQTRYAGSAGRWMLLTTATMGRPWKALQLAGGPPSVIKLTSLVGFQRVEE